jgi:hypothetical protein
VAAVHASVAPSLSKINTIILMCNVRSGAQNLVRSEGTDGRLPVFQLVCCVFRDLGAPARMQDGSITPPSQELPTL